MKVAINVCHGGFGLSPDALHRLAKLKGLSIQETESQLYGYGDDEPLSRADPDLIRAVEETPEPSDILGELKIVEIPDGIEWTVEQYDGAEWVAEKHRTWY